MNVKAKGIESRAVKTRAGRGGTGRGRDVAADMGFTPPTAGSPCRARFADPRAGQTRRSWNLSKRGLGATSSPHGWCCGLHEQLVGRAPCLPALRRRYPPTVSHRPDTVDCVFKPAPGGRADVTCARPEKPQGRVDLQPSGGPPGARSSKPTLFECGGKMPHPTPRMTAQSATNKQVSWITAMVKLKFRRLRARRVSSWTPEGPCKCDSKQDVKLKDCCTGAGGGAAWDENC